jgi:hypothetical protein
MRKLSKRLQQLIENFKTGNPSLADHQSAHGRCTEASYAFRRLAIEDGIKCTTWEIVLDDEHDRHYCPEWYPNIIFEGHTVVYVESVVIDWTVRQYNGDAPFPLIYTPPKQAAQTGIDELDPALVNYVRY